MKCETQIVSNPVYQIVLTLTKEEAEALHQVSGSIVGVGELRDTMDKIYHALNKLDILDNYKYEGQVTYNMKVN